MCTCARWPTGLGVDDVVGTELVVDRTAAAPAGSLGGNCRGPEKVARLHAWLDEHHGGPWAVELWAYGDTAAATASCSPTPIDRSGPRTSCSTAAPSRGPAVSGVVGGLVRTARPQQWMKNVLVFAAPGAAGVLDHWDDLWRTLLAFVAFCLGASGIYFWNDALDVEADRIHPTKRRRPIATGVVPVRTAKVVGSLLPVAGLGVAALTGRWQAGPSSASTSSC